MSHKIEIKIDGMSCDHCKRAVENALQKVEGVESVVVHWQEGKAVVTGNADPAMLIKNVEDEGYQANVFAS